MESPTRIPRVVPSQVTRDNYYKGIFLSPTFKTSGACSKSGSRQGAITPFAKWREVDFCDGTWWTFFQNFHRDGDRVEHAVVTGPRSPRCSLCQCAQRHAGLPARGTWLSSVTTWLRKLPSWLALKVYSKAALTTFYSVVSVGFPLVSICILPRLTWLPGEVISAFPATKRCAISQNQHPRDCIWDGCSHHAPGGKGCRVEGKRR